ncbi:MAG: PVC-type heme-binding CxxCH protein, partial [Planctomycetota bacterium]
MSLVHFSFASAWLAVAVTAAAGDLKYQGLPAEEAAAAMRLPEGFRVVPFAAEPDVVQPIAMTIDRRGRVWVAEGHSYPIKRKPGEGKDRILIFEDTDGDGRQDKRTVFADGLNLVSGLEVGFGGVFVGQAPELLFFPDADGDDLPDGPPEVLLDGWHMEDTHETLNSFIWGPDGWLYGCHGVFTHSRVGPPGTPEAERVPINAGIWRYHPTSRAFEVFAHGTSNPWGVDFDRHGQSFLTCCVIPHLFHVVPGARYFRQAGRHFDPHVYEDIPTIAKHRHFVGFQWDGADKQASLDYGGGHAHAGALIYQGDAWPAEYRGRLLMNNIHGARLNADSLTPQGSGFVGDRLPDFCLTDDLASQMLYLRVGPDGNVFVIDWYDTNQCHHRGIEGHDRSNGRIWKIIYEGDREPAGLSRRTGLSGEESDEELVNLLTHPNVFHRRQAQRLLQERGPDEAGIAALGELFASEKPLDRLRALWALSATSTLTDEHLTAGLVDGDTHVRLWAVRLLAQSLPALPMSAGVPRAIGTLPPFPRFGDPLPELVELARTEHAAPVRLELASFAQRLPSEERWGLLATLLAHGEDAGDHNLPLMLWYAVEPLVPA